jgi:hypothetical protein
MVLAKTDGPARTGSTGFSAGSAIADLVGSGAAGLRSSTGGGGEGLLRLRMGKVRVSGC